MQEVVYNAQLKTQRSEWHAAVARAMEIVYAHQLAQYAGPIAFHWELAGQRQVTNQARPGEGKSAPSPSLQRLLKRFF